MRLDRFIAKQRIIDINSSVLEGAMKELLEVCPLPAEDPSIRAKLLKDLIDREKSMTTYLGNGVALPHLRIPMKRPYIFALGRCQEGLEYEGMEEYRDLRLIFLLLASDKEKSYLNVLAALARIFHDKALIEKLTETLSLEDFKTQAKKSFGGIKTTPSARKNKFNNLILRECAKIGKGAGCSTVMIFGDTFEDGIGIGKSLSGFKTILVSQSDPGRLPNKDTIDMTLTVRSFSPNRLSQMKSAVLIGLSRGILQFNDKICCVAGIPKSNQFDTVVVVDIEREFQAVFSKQSEMLPGSVKPEVMERVLAIATELSVEGREGKPVGCFFVIGDHNELKPFVKPLVLNPFYGYKDEDRNILNPFMNETVKEFSTIDGAFIIRGDGVLESAGSLIYAPGFSHELPGGLGSRHVAAAAISQAIDCIAITVSSSGPVTIFRRGQMLPLT